MSVSHKQDTNKAASVQLDREGRLFMGMVGGIETAIAGADHREEQQGYGPMTSPEIVTVLAWAVADVLGERGIKKEEFLAEVRNLWW
jgi:hypothetical protein